MSSMAVTWTRTAFKRFWLGVRVTFWALVASAVCLVAWELQTFGIQSRQLASLAGDAGYELVPGASVSIAFPYAGPYDVRLGYPRIPEFTERLGKIGFEIERQASFSPGLRKLVGWGVSPLYREKTQAGLTITAADGRLLYARSYPERIYESFEAVPKLLVDSLLFVENRELLDPSRPRRNPAVEWDRLARGAIALGLEKIDGGVVVPGGSTLATQIEKFRHSPGGVTSSPGEKLRQMLTASLRAYRNGDDTTETRQQIVVDYINSVALAAVPGLGEVIGIPEGLQVWYGRDFRVVSSMLEWPRPGSIDSGRQARARAYKEALSLLLAARRPTDYLVRDRDKLDARTNAYLEILAQNGVISQQLKEDAIDIELDLRSHYVGGDPSDMQDRQVVAPVRRQVAGMLGVGSYYDLDRMDVVVESTLDGSAQRAMVQLMNEISDRERTASLGLTGPRLLTTEDVTPVVYSFSLWESVGDANVLRVQADNSPAAFGVDDTVRLDLGSSAKLRTLVTYLDVIAALHLRLAHSSRTELAAVAASASDALTRWAAERLYRDPDESLPAFLDAAMLRRYSASPYESFFTGGGRHRFRNFDDAFDHSEMTVEGAFQHSVNLVFIRLIRDIARYFMYGPASEYAGIFADPRDERRDLLLRRFAEYEGAVFVNRFYRRHQDKSEAQRLDSLLSGGRPTPRRFATILRAFEPQRDRDWFKHEFSARWSEVSAERRAVYGDPTEREIELLYDNYDPSRFGLQDISYLSRVHPLELWVVQHLREHPGATRQEVLAASTEARLDAYRWLLKSGNRAAQDTRIRIMVERAAFDQILASWQRYGYPFESITPSYAAAIGASGDRPSALAQLVGIVVNDGRRLPTRRIEKLGFAEGTPYETVVVAPKGSGEQVMAPAVAAVIRRAMVGVVQGGTARRADGSFRYADGTPLVVGGKTGTGDHYQRAFSADGEEIDARAVSRAATFVYFIEDRYFGIVTAYVTGEEAGSYSFTSSLPVQLFRSVAPIISQTVTGREPSPTLDTVDSEIRPAVSQLAEEVRG